MVINDRRVAGANVKPRGPVLIRAPTAVLSKIFMYGLLIVEREQGMRETTSKDITYRGVKKNCKEKQLLPQIRQDPFVKM